MNLALQGGGSHGAFTWGVLDGLLEDGRVSFEGVSGASAGAMNGVVLTEGWRRGLAERRDPREAAREQLSQFWLAVGDIPNAMALAAPLAWKVPSLGGTSATLFDVMSLFYSPYQANPFDINPLRDLLAKQVDFDALRAHAPFRLFISATNVKTGRARIFRGKELRLEMLMASAALPTAFRAVEIDGEFYWDGGYMGNPALHPLFNATHTRDLLLVQINPLARDSVPDTPQEIIERVNEISFNSSLLHELRAIDFVQRLLRDRRIDAAQYKGILMHAIDAENYLAAYGAASKINTARAFLEELHGLGRQAAADWLQKMLPRVGHASSISIEERYL